MLALALGWIYGAQALSEGYEAIAFYRGEQVDVHALVDAVANPAARQAAIEAGEHWLVMKEGAKPRELPVGVASLLLGGVMVLFAARSMAGREGARSGLVQVALVHAGVVVAGFLLLKDVARAESEFHLRLAEGVTHGVGDAAAQESARRITEAFVHAFAPIAVFLRTLLSGSIVFALTRPRARAFFREAETGPLGQG
jgi:hypothetical protein